METSKNARVYRMSFASVYPLYVAKVEKKGRTKAELNDVIEWLTGYNEKQLSRVIEAQLTFEEFFSKAPLLNPKRKQINGMICGIKVQDISEPLMQEIRYLDKVVDELARNKTIGTIKRS